MKTITDRERRQALDVLVVGAGPAGLGCALALDAVDDLRFGIVERGTVGETFRHWPTEQRLLTPSFTSNGYGSPDLNSVHPDTSPAYSFETDYLSGVQYAGYLRGVAAAFDLPVLENTAVRSVRRDGGLFLVGTDRGPVPCRNIIWAGGEHHDPRLPELPGAQHLQHSASSAAWQRREGPVVVIGGYESGIDLACHHIADGAEVIVVDGDEPWSEESVADPSVRLSPRTLVRLRGARATGRLTLIGSSARSVTRHAPTPGTEEYVVLLGNGRRVRSATPPVAATGFGPGLGPVTGLFDRRPDGWPLLDEDDCSTTTPGLYLSGPAVRHDARRFCFIYKFRQRFAHIARVIGESLGQDCGGLDHWRDEGMLIDDLDCCGTVCAC
jgi:putative flavoprotein involved in K+ transport